MGEKETEAKDLRRYKKDKHRERVRERKTDRQTGIENRKGTSLEVYKQKHRTETAYFD